MKQDYILKKFVKAENATEAAALDKDTPVSEIILAESKPQSTPVDVIGFKQIDAKFYHEY